MYPMNPQLLQLTDSVSAMLDTLGAHQLTSLEDAAPVAGEGLALAAPASTDLSQRSAIPLLLLSNVGGVRQWEVEKRSNTRFIVSERYGETTVHDAYPPDPRKRESPDALRSRRGEMPSGTSASQMTSTAELFDLERLTGKPPRPVRYAITAIAHDWRSNTVQSFAYDPKVPFSPPTALSAEGARTSFPGPPPPELPFDWTAEGLGAAFAPVTGSSAARLLVRLAVNADEVVPVNSGGDAALPRGVLLVTVVLAPRDQRSARTQALHVPVYSAPSGTPLAGAGPAQNALLAGSAALDVQGLFEGAPDDSVVYVAASKFVAGPLNRPD